MGWPCTKIETDVMLILFNLPNYFRARYVDNVDDSTLAHKHIHVIKIMRNWDVCWTFDNNNSSFVMFSKFFQWNISFVDLFLLLFRHTGYLVLNAVHTRYSPSKIIQNGIQIVAQQFTIYIVNWKRYRRERKKNWKELKRISMLNFYMWLKWALSSQKKINFNMICSSAIFYGFQWNIRIEVYYTNVI